MIRLHVQPTDGVGCGSGGGSEGTQTCHRDMCEFTEWNLEAFKYSCLFRATVPPGYCSAEKLKYTSVFDSFCLACHMK